MTSFTACHGIFISEKSSCTNTSEKTKSISSIIITKAGKYYTFQKATCQNTMIINHLLLFILIGKPCPNHSHQSSLLIFHSLLIIRPYFLHRTYHYLQTSYLFICLLSFPRYNGWKLQKTGNFVHLIQKCLQHLTYSRHSFVE